MSNNYKPLTPAKTVEENDRAKAKAEAQSEEVRSLRNRADTDPNANKVPLNPTHSVDRLGPNPTVAEVEANEARKPFNSTFNVDKLGPNRTPAEVADATKADADAAEAYAKNKANRPAFNPTAYFDRLGPNPTAAEVADARRLDAEAKSQADSDANVGKGPQPKAPAPYNLTSEDRFVLKDTNNDGIPDIIVVERYKPQEKAEAERVSKYSAYYRHIQNARAEASERNAGRVADEVTAAENVAEAEAKRKWKGPVPPPSEAELKHQKDKDDAAREKAAITAEVERLAKEKV